MIYPHVQALLSSQETDLRTGAETDLAFSVNMSFLALVLGVMLGIDRAIERPASLLYVLVCTAPMLLAFVFYEIATVAAINWGNTVRAAIDLHRLDFYDKLGVRRPVHAADTESTGAAINRMLLYGEVLPDRIRLPRATA